VRTAVDGIANGNELVLVWAELGRSQKVLQRLHTALNIPHKEH
jgi:hypothetical protein